MKQVRWGIIGCGDVTEVKSGPAFQQAEGSSLVAVMRRSGELANDYAQRHGVPKWYDDAEALINDPEVDAIYIATPPDSHKTYTLLCAQAGKAVYVEKPMALNYAECKEMIDACRTAEVPLFVAYYRRALPAFLKVKELIDTGSIGDIRSVNIRLFQPVLSDAQLAGILPWRVQPEIAGGGLFVDLASHMLDFLDYAIGPIKAAQGLASNQAGKYPAEDIVTATFLFDSGAHGTGTWCFSTHDSQDKTEIIGSKGRITYSTFVEEPVILETTAGIEKLSFVNPHHIQQPLIQTVVDAQLEKGACPSTGETGARTSWVMEQMLKLMGGDRTTIKPLRAKTKIP
jgi:predicted dehydrogenase